MFIDVYTWCELSDWFMYIQGCISLFLGRILGWSGCKQTVENAALWFLWFPPQHRSHMTTFQKCEPEWRLQWLLCEVLQLLRSLPSLNWGRNKITATLHFRSSIHMQELLDSACRPCRSWSRANPRSAQKYYYLLTWSNDVASSISRDVIFEEAWFCWIPGSCP